MRQQVVGEILWPDPDELEEMFIRDPRSGCWNWKKRVQKGAYDSGYGVFSLKCEIDGFNWFRTMPAHRVVYLVLRGQIPKALHLDHLCRNPRCVNPDHLEPVTAQENVRRGLSYKRGSKDRCPRGHVLSPENLGNSVWGSFCRTCRKASSEKRQKKNEQSYKPIPRDPKKRNQFDRKILAKLLAAIDRGEAPADIARRFSFNPILICHLRQRYRPGLKKKTFAAIPRDPMDRRKYAPAIVAALTKAFAKHKSATAVAEAFNFNPILVWHFQKRLHNAKDE